MKAVEPCVRDVLGACIIHGSTKSKTLMPGRCQQFGDLTLSNVMEQHNCATGLRDDDND